MASAALRRAAAAAGPLLRQQSTGPTTVHVPGAVLLPADSNQALGIAHYAIDFLKSGRPDAAVLAKTNDFFTDACMCGASALALRTNAPTVLRREALRYALPSAAGGATLFASTAKVHPEKAVLASAAAVREWDSNGTNFGYRKELGHTAGEFGHNDFYGVALAAAELAGRDGAFALRAMLCIDEIRGRLAEVFSLKSYKIDHVVHGAIASAAVYGAALGATPEQIESAIGMVVAHNVPFRAIRAGKQLSDSKGSSAAISTEAAVLAVRRSMDGFMGPRDIFRNPEAIFRLFEGPGQMLQKVGAASANTAPRHASPFDLVLSKEGSDFSVMGMHFKLGLYEHQSAGALQGLVNLLSAQPQLLARKDGGAIARITIVAYEPAYGIIGDPAKMDPRTRQSADHSMAYIVATKLRKALQAGTADWREIMLGPFDYSKAAVFDPLTRALMAKIDFRHGGAEYDARYPDGIPTSVVIEPAAGGTPADSGLVMYPVGHARNTTADLRAYLDVKWRLLGGLAAPGADLAARFGGLGARSAAEVAALNAFEVAERRDFEDA